MPRPEVTQAAELLYGRLWPYTLEDEANEWHLLLFCDAIAGELFEQVRSYVADREDMLGWEVVFNVDTCPVEALPYLAQFVGVHFEPSETVEQQRNKIKERPAFKRGTPASLVAAAKLRLTGGKNVYMEERFEGFAYRLLIRVLGKETPDPDGTKADILKQKPAGIKLVFEVVSMKTYAEIKADYEDYADYKAGGSYEEAAAL